MTETMYPVGYGTARITMAESQRRFSDGMEPEYARRLFSWLASQGGKFGIGSAWRPTPSAVSLASKLGRSFHQTQRFFDSFEGFCAVDLVVYTSGGLHRAPSRTEALWQGSKAATQAGLHMNISDETWHMQPIEIDGWQSWVDAGRKRPKAGYQIPTGGVIVTPPPAMPGFPPFRPEAGEFSLYPLATNKPTLKQGMTGQPNDSIRYFQAVCRLRANQVTLAIDGFYGNASVQACKNVQAWCGATVDGICGPQTWKAIDAMALR